MSAMPSTAVSTALFSNSFFDFFFFLAIFFS
jgi:hypothetical protein